MKYTALDDEEICRILDKNEATAVQEAGGYQSITKHPNAGIVFVRHFCHLMGMSTLRRLRALELRIQDLEQAKSQGVK